MRICASLIALVVGSACAMAQSGGNWDYAGKTGPLAWGKLDPAYQACSKGHEQSPIDIHGAHLNKKLQPIEFHYIAGSVEVENTGNLIVVRVRPGSYIVAEGVRYDLQQFEFHHPSETAVKGKLTDMDVELLHKSSDGKLAVIEIRMALDRGAIRFPLARFFSRATMTSH